MNILETPINHETRPHCCGCWSIVYDPEIELPKLVCNECGVEVPLRMPNELEILGGELRKAMQGWGELRIKLEEAQKWFDEHRAG